MPFIDFDPVKDTINRTKHGLSLDQASDLGWATAVIRPDDRRDYGERRLRAYAMLGGRLHMVVYTPRGDRLRIISLRRANNREVRRYGPEAQPGSERL